MVKVIDDGNKLYRDANAEALAAEFGQRAAVIKARYAALTTTSIWARAVRYLAMQRELRRERREVYGNDSLYLAESNNQVATDKL